MLQDLHHGIPRLCPNVALLSHLRDCNPSANVCWRPENEREGKNKRKSKVITYFKGPPLQKHSKRTYTPKP